MKQCLGLLRDIQENGTGKGDLTGTGTPSVFGQFRHNLADGFPLLTTKKLNFKNIANELIRFLSGDTNTAWLNENGVSIWDEWTTENGELGPIYGRQWTAGPTKDGGSVNQIDYVINCLDNNPNSRRILFHGWKKTPLMLRIANKFLTKFDYISIGCKGCKTSSHYQFALQVSEGV